MPKKILIVDDEINVVKLLAARLKANNYDVVTATDGLYAVIKAHDEKPDLVLLDVNMPAGGGVSVFENLLKTGDTMMTPVIFITAYPDEELRRKVLEMGAEDFIPKPFDPEELIAKIKKALQEDTGTQGSTDPQGGGRG
jgi:DNA-binding response OmpR family regulator